MKFWETPATKKVLNNILKVQNNGWHDKFDPKKKFKIMQWKFRTTRARKSSDIFVVLNNTMRVQNNGSNDANTDIDGFK